MGDAVIVSTARTAIGTARKGTLLDVSAFDLAKYAAGEALVRSGVDKDAVDDLQMGEVLQGGGDIARYRACIPGNPARVGIWSLLCGRPRTARARHPLPHGSG